MVVSFFNLLRCGANVIVQPYVFWSVTGISLGEIRVENVKVTC